MLSAGQRATPIFSCMLFLIKITETVICTQEFRTNGKPCCVAKTVTL